MDGTMLSTGSAEESLRTWRPIIRRWRPIDIILGAVVDDTRADSVRVSVIATGFERPCRTPLFAEDSTGRRREPRRRDVKLDDRQRASLEISDDEIDVPSFLKD